ncbi:MAG: hypothetical protein ACD_75C01274G0002 [uncultured bacterium]|nr:MAG: hypothetical protein ACD_75C01274G0002 [uncultured bacterium]
MQPTHPLKKEVGRADLGDEPVEVHIKRLLNHLGCHQNSSLVPGTFRPIAADDLTFDALSIFKTIAGMEQING